MAGTSKKTTVVGVRVPNETLAEWRGVIGDGAASAFILDRAMRATELEAVAEGWRAAHMRSEVEKVELRATLDAVTNDPNAMTIRLLPEVLGLIPGNDKVAMVEAYVNERFSYGRHRLEDFLKVKEKGKRQ